jgi:hypothetical protein
MDIWQLLILGFALWFAFGWGKEYGRKVQRKRMHCTERLRKTKDPETRQKLLLEWNNLTGRHFAPHLLANKRKGL